MNFSRSARSSFILNGLGNLTPPVCMFLVSVLLARELGVEGRGESAAAVSPFLLATAVATLGLPDAVTHFVARSGRITAVVMRRSGLLLVLSGIVSTAVLIVSRHVLSGNIPSVANGIALSAFAIVPTMLVLLLRGAAAGIGMWHLVACEKAVGGGSRFAIVVVLLLVGQLNPVSAALAVSFGPVVGMLAYLALPRTGAGRQFDHASEPVPNVVGYALRLWVGSIAGILLMRIDQVMIVPLSSAQQLGLYAVAVSVGEVVLIMVNTVREVIFASDSRSDIGARICEVARLTSLFGLLLCCVISVSLPIWFTAVFGDEFQSSIPVTIGMLFAVTCGASGSIAGACLSARGNPGLRSAALCVACLVNIVLVLMTVPVLGAWGAVLATLVGNLVSSNLNIYFVKRKFGYAFREFYGVRINDLRIAREYLRIRRRVNA